MSYAQHTVVPVDRSKAQIESLLIKYGANGFASGWDGRKAQLMFKLGNRAIRIQLTLPDPKDWSQNGLAQEERRLWRALLLVVKAKLESVESGVETFDQAWLPHIVMPGGGTVYAEIAKGLEAAYQGRPMPLLLGSGQ